MRMWHLLVGIVTLLGGAVIWVVDVDGHSDGDKRHTAITQAQMFVKQCATYRNKQENGNFPTTLAELVAPTGGRKPQIEGGELALQDP